MSESMDQLLAEQLETRKQKHLYRSRRLLQSPQSVDVQVDGKAYINFCSNDYLGLANHPRLIDAAQLAVKQYGAGSGASHLVCGHSQVHHDLEVALAERTGRERALLFSTGYMANLGVISALLGKGDAVFEDKLNHASLLDGGLLSGARFQRFLHNNLEDLERRLARTKARRKLVVVDSVFSMDGDFAPLSDLAALTKKYDAWLMVDDAHGFGCLGQRGSGAVNSCGLSQSEVPVLMGTLGKAVGSFGAFVAGSETLIETLIQQARSYIYTTAMPPAVAAASLESLSVIEQEPWRQQHLTTLIDHFRSQAARLGLPLMNSQTAIQPLLVGDSQTALVMASELSERGFLIGAIRPPTVPQGTARLRITFSASHTIEQVDSLLMALGQIYSSQPAGAPL